LRRRGEFAAATGCDEKKAPPPAAVSPTPAPAPAAPPPAAAAPAAAAAGAVATLAQIDAVKLPAPPKAPASGAWQTVGAMSGDGDKMANFVDGDKYLLSVRIMDCRSPKFAAYAAKPAAEQGDMAACFQPGDAKLKTYDMRKVRDGMRTVKAGNIALILNLGADPSAAKLWITADLETYLGSLDLDALAKL
jgi:pyruvate/2-oxoglutarate dehydrogenase complex dihydrolipoamide acyltransferase (E2) component